MVAGLLLVIGLFAGCGGSGDPTGDDIAQKVQHTIEQPGMVYHALENDGTELWIDAANKQYRKKDSAAEGRLVSVGKDWNQIYYDPFANTVGTKDLSPKASASPRVSNPAISWSDALGAMGYAANLDLTTKSTADGIEVWVLQATTPIRDKQGNPAGSLAARVEVDANTNLPHAYEKHETVANGSTPTADPAGVLPNRRIVYKTSEMITRDSLPADFFGEAAVSAQLQTPEQNLEKIRALGLAPVWLGERYEGPGGPLALPADTGVFAKPTDKAGEIHYSLYVQVSATQVTEEKDAIIIRTSKDLKSLKAPTIPQIGGILPEQLTAAPVHGGPGVLYTSTLTPNDLPCPNGGCPVSGAALYRRLQFSVGDTAVQLEVAARIGAGGRDANGYNGKDAIVALAEALFEPPAPTPGVTPTPVGPVP